MQEDLEEPWGQLVSTEMPPGVEEERVPILGKTFLIGRYKDAELVISGNSFVSTQHCLLLRDEEGGKWVSDVSTNGTLLNGKRLEKNKRVRLSDGDVIGVVFKKDRPDYNVVYKFQDLGPTPESQPGGEGGSTLDSTLEVDYREMEEELAGKDKDSSGREETVGKKRAKERGETESEGAPSAKKLSLAPEEKNSTAALSPTEKEVLVEASVIEPAAKPALVKTDSIAETLVCQICQEIFHDCVSLQPCMHCYCAGCYSDWMKHSNKCPACRSKVRRISKNHLVNNLVEAFLRANPERKRPVEDLKELDEKNKITKDMLYPKHRHHYHYDDSGEESNSSLTDESNSSDTDSSSLPPPLHLTGGLYTGGPFPSWTGSALVSRAPPYTCRQCPGFMGVRHHPSHPPPPPFTCSLSTNHVLCLCCLQPMPDRRLETDVSVPPQKCDLCGQAFCHMYWGCNKPGCTGCLGLFQDMEFSDTALANLINENVFETTILKDYLQSQHKTVQDMLRECCTKLDSGEYTCADSSTHHISSGSRTCFRCALKNFKDLAYHYRTELPNEDLPASVTRRSNCHWGKNCRTQKHNIDHARRFNHICEQTRTS